MFMVSFAFRFVACYVATKKETTIAYNDIAYDLLALLAVFLWVKTLSLLDGIQYFGKRICIYLTRFLSTMPFHSAIYVRQQPTWV